MAQDSANRLEAVTTPKMAMAFSGIFFFPLIPLRIRISIPVSSICWPKLAFHGWGFSKELR